MNERRKEDPSLGAGEARPPGGGQSAPWSRRRFLGAAASAASVVMGSRNPRAVAAVGGRNVGSSRRSRVVQVQSEYVVRGREVHEAVLDEMLASSLTELTGRANAREAWRTLVRPDDVIGLKFNRSGRETIGTTPAMARAIVRSLQESGFSPGQIVCIELPDRLAKDLGTATPALGYETEVMDFGSGSDRLARVVSQVSVLISVPFLKTHNIAGMTCALKNLSHGLIKHPARFHDNGCSPFIADIVALPQIRRRLRLSIVDALRVVYDGGPDPVGDTVADAGAILVSRDPVAAEAVGLGVINEIRSGYNLDPVAKGAEDLGYLREAVRRGLGHSAAHRIDLVLDRH